MAGDRTKADRGPLIVDLLDGQDKDPLRGVASISQSSRVSLAGHRIAELRATASMSRASAEPVERCNPVRLIGDGILVRLAL